MPLIPEEGQMETFIGEALKQLISDSATKGPVSDAQVGGGAEVGQREDGGSGRRLSRPDDRSP